VGEQQSIQNINKFHYRKLIIIIPLMFWRQRQRSMSDSASCKIDCKIFCSDI